MSITLVIYRYIVWLFDFSAMVSHIITLVALTALATAQERHVAAAYNILMIPFPGKSHLFSMAAIANSLVSRGHRVSFLVGEHFTTAGVTDVGNTSSISVIRHDDTNEHGVWPDYDAELENVVVQGIVKRLDKWTIIPSLRDMYRLYAVIVQCILYLSGGT